jgi:hypothetical protein
MSPVWQFGKFASRLYPLCSVVGAENDRSRAGLAWLVGRILATEKIFTATPQPAVTIQKSQEVKIQQAIEALNNGRSCV